MSISSDQPDWSRESKTLLEWNPGKSLLACIRRYQAARGRNGVFSRFSRALNVVAFRFWSAVSGADIPLNTSIGGGLLLPHPNGVVIHPAAVIGPNCLIFQQVTIGSREGGVPPEIGGHVDIGAGAKLLGPIRIGAHAVIGANAVVLSDVPSGFVATGIPATVRPRRIGAAT